MKRIALLLALFCLGLVTASLAVAKAPPGKGKPDDKGKQTTTSSTNGKGKKKSATDAENCKPKISVILKGKFVSGGGSSFTMDVTQANSHGREFAGKTLSLNVDEKTRFVRRGPAELSDFEAGDRLNVQARACKKPKGQAAASDAAAAPMLAKRVVGRPANPAEEARDGTTTTTATP